jgi:hypothetical protein
VTQWEEGCTGSPSRASPGRRWWCGDRAMAVKEQQWWHLVRAVLERGEKRGRAGRGAVEDGGALPLYRRCGGGGSRWLRWRNGQC